MGMKITARYSTTTSGSALAITFTRSRNSSTSCAPASQSQRRCLRGAAFAVYVTVLDFSSSSLAGFSSIVWLGNTPSENALLKKELTPPPYWLNQEYSSDYTSGSTSPTTLCPACSYAAVAVEVL